MGVRVGQVTSVVPRGTSVLVEMEYDGEHDLPEDVQAVIVSPSVIGDRFVQLTPAYDGGPRLDDGSTIAMEDTAVPVELDDMVASTRDLVSALGPEGANRDGALSDLHQARLRACWTARVPPSGSRWPTCRSERHRRRVVAEFGSTVEHLALTRELAEYDAAVRHLRRPARPGWPAAWPADRGGLSDLLSSMAVSLGEVEQFVRTNRRSLTRNVGSLRDVAPDAPPRAARDHRGPGPRPAGLHQPGRGRTTPTPPPWAPARTPEIVRALDKALCDELEKQLRPDFRENCGVVSELFSLLPLREGCPTRPQPPLGPGTRGSQAHRPVGPGLPDLPGLPGRPWRRSPDPHRVGGSHETRCWPCSPRRPARWLRLRRAAGPPLPGGPDLDDPYTVTAEVPGTCSAWRRTRPAKVDGVTVGEVADIHRDGPWHAEDELRVDGGVLGSPRTLIREDPADQPARREVVSSAAPNRPARPSLDDGDQDPALPDEAGGARSRRRRGHRVAAARTAAGWSTCGIDLRRACTPARLGDGDNPPLHRGAAAPLRDYGRRAARDDHLHPRERRRSLAAAGQRRARRTHPNWGPGGRWGRALETLVDQRRPLAATLEQLDRFGLDQRRR